MKLSKLKWGLKFIVVIQILLLIKPVNAEISNKQANIVIILADDMGYSDIGCYGSDIPTPNLDALAKNGLRFNQFYNTARCSPSRASILTGLHPHQAGMGRLAEKNFGETNEGEPGYLGYLNNNCVTLAEVLQTAGYQTFVSGKWHVGMRDESKWPLQRGFDRFYGVLAGGTSYFKPKGVRCLSLNNKHLPTPTDTNYYTTDAFTDFAIQTVNERDEAKPFFLYLAYNAPHWPLHARKEDIERFKGKYKKGWDVLRSEKFERMKELGVLDSDDVLSPRDKGVRSWDSLSSEEKARMEYRMEVYAAQVYRLDWNIGRLVDALKESGELENTVLIFLSDNGASAEPYKDLGGGKQSSVNNPDVYGPISYGSGWANYSNVPYRRYKSMLHEGGIISPFIIHWPKGLKTKAGAFTSRPACILDLMNTAVDLSGAKYPYKFKGNKIIPMQGESLLPIIENSTEVPGERVFYWEHVGYKAIRQGNFKAECSIRARYDKLGTGEWELYDLGKDKLELQNLADQQPEKLDALIEQWNIWAEGANVFPMPGKSNKK